MSRTYKWFKRYGFKKINASDYCANITKLVLLKQNLLHFLISIRTQLKSNSSEIFLKIVSGFIKWQFIFLLSLMICPRKNVTKLKVQWAKLTSFKIRFLLWCICRKFYKIWRHHANDTFNNGHTEIYLWRRIMIHAWSWRFVVTFREYESFEYSSVLLWRTLEHEYRTGIRIYRRTRW